MTEPIQSSISRADFLDSYIKLYQNIKDYESLIRKFSEPGNLDPQMILDEVHDRINHLEFGGVNVKAMEIIGAYLRYTLDHFKGDQLNFLLNDDLAEEGLPLDDGYCGLSKSISDVEKDLAEIDARIFYLIRYLPPQNVDKIKLVVKAISSLFKAIIRKDHVDMENCANHLHHLTANKESYFLINEIGHMVRNIHNSIKDFSDGVPTEHLDAGVMDEMPDAIDKLNLVIQRMESAANSTLDEVEGLLDKNSARQEQNVQMLEDLGEVEQKLNALKEANPAMAEGLDEVIGLLNEKVGMPLTERSEELKSDESVYFEIIGSQSFQDLTGQTLKKIIRFIEQLELSLLEILKKYSGRPGQAKDQAPQGEQISPLVGKQQDGLVLEGPQDNLRLHGEDTRNQGDIDKMLAEFGF